MVIFHKLSPNGLAKQKGGFGFCVCKWDTVTNDYGITIYIEWSVDWFLVTNILNTDNLLYHVLRLIWKNFFTEPPPKNLVTLNLLSFVLKILKLFLCNIQYFYT